MFANALFIQYGFYGDSMAPQLIVHKKDAEAFESTPLRGKTLTLSFDTSQRFCTGWHDLATTQSFPCPDAAELPAQFSQCRHCQNKTGFNPAFYHAASVSPQQQARNATPHFLYLAHFGTGVIKVGISWAARGLSRLLDQGARSALVIKTYPTATVARQYEAKVASLDGIAETLQVRAKHKLLGSAYDAKLGASELLAARQRLIDEFGITPDNNQPEALDRYYFGDAQLMPPIFLHDDKISGRCLGMIGSTIITEQDEQQFGLGLGDFIGYRMSITNAEELNSHSPQQTSLF